MEYSNSYLLGSGDELKKRETSRSTWDNEWSAIRKQTQARSEVYICCRSMISWQMRVAYTPYYLYHVFILRGVSIRVWIHGCYVGLYRSIVDSDIEVKPLPFLQKSHMTFIKCEIFIEVSFSNKRASCPLLHDYGILSNIQPASHTGVYILSDHISYYEFAHMSMHRSLCIRACMHAYTLI